MVNKDDPFLDTILKEALEAGSVAKITGGGSYSKFAGYQDLDGDGDTFLEVLTQVFAVWNVFQRHKIKYSNITTTSSANQSVVSQYVRTPRESFENTQANCVDGSVLFASILRKLDLNPFLVIEPGHMFVGYWLDTEQNTPFVLETTMLGAENLDAYTKDDSWLGKLKGWTGLGKTASQVSWDSFWAATATAEAELDEIKEQLVDETNREYQIIDIAVCRAGGIQPVRRISQ